MSEHPTIPEGRVRREEATTYGGVLSRPAAAVVATLVALGTVLTLGWKLRDAVGGAEAATMDSGGIAAIRKDIGEIKGDLRLVKCRLNIENICPQNERNDRQNERGRGQ